MAYRQLLALACFALGNAVVACGSGGNAPYDPPADTDGLPANGSDQPPSNPDRPPGNPDQPPGNADQPGGAPAPGGGGDSEADAEAACHALCDKVGTTNDACPGTGANAIARALCATNCAITEDIRRCLNQAVALVSCLGELDGLCTEDGPSDAAAARCNTAATELNDCTEGDTANPPAGGGGDTCTQDGDQCAGCSNTCDICKCASPDATICDSLCN